MGHGAYSEDEVRLSFVWGEGADASVLTIDRRILEFPNEDRAPHAGNVLRVVLERLACPSSMQPFHSVIAEEAAKVLAGSAATGILGLRIELESDFNDSPDIAHCNTRPHSPLTDPPVFIFLG